MLTFELTFDFGSHQLGCQKQLKKGEIIGLYGKSGIGKSTVLRSIAGLHKPHYAKISWQHTAWNDSKKNIFIYPQYRSVGLVFQDYALFPHLTVLENLQYGQRISEESLSGLIDALSIENILKQKPNEISGGQQQRTAIGRAITYNPKILLMDEPFSALDNHTKSTVRSFLKDYINENEKTTIIASHDQTDLRFFSNDIIHLSTKE